MPGESFSGPLPPLSNADRALASELRAHVTKLAAEIGVRRAVEGDSLHQAEQYLHLQLTAAAPSRLLKIAVRGSTSAIESVERSHARQGPETVVDVVPAVA
jgi:hypothetical protein